MMGDESLHIVVFPWLAFGHMMPFLELSEGLAKRGHRISFLSTPRNIARLPKVPSRLIDFVALPLPSVDGLPENAEATSDLPPEKVQLLKRALDGLEGGFARFIREASPKPDWIIHDFAQHWAPAAAGEIGVPCAFFSVLIAAVLAFGGPLSQLEGGSRKTPEDFTVPPAWIPFPSKVAFRLHEAKEIFKENFTLNSSGMSDGQRMKLVIEGCKAIAPRSCRELENEWLCLLQELYQKPVIPTGLLPPHAAQNREVIDSHGIERNIMEWLNGQNLRTVIYVAFGSEATLSIELLHELALGLELAKVPFIWALRRPSTTSERMEILPEGFEDRTRGSGMVLMGWVPQLKILSHPSVGGFLTHCGFSSVVESLQFGHPLVSLPIFGDQGLNARVIEEMGIAVEVERNEEDGSFSKVDVAKALRLVMLDDGVERYRSKAKEMVKLFADKDKHEKYVDDFIRHLRENANREGY